MTSISDAPPLIVLALPGLDGALLRRSVDDGSLPRLAALFDGGTWAPCGLDAAQASCPAEVWTTALTGEWPEVHGVLHPRARLSRSLFHRPVEATALRVAGLATLAADAGRRVASIGWPATRGLQLAGGWTIAPEADLSSDAPDADAPLDPLAALPAAAADLVRALRLHPRELGAADVGFFLGALPAGAHARLAPPLADALARAATRHAWATQALAELSPDLLLLHWPLLAELAELAAGLPRAAGEALARRGLRFVDRVLAPYLDATPAARLLLLSDRGLALAAGPGVARDRMAAPLAATAVFDLVAGLAGLAPAGRPLPPSAAAFLEDAAAARQAIARPESPAPLTASDFPDDADLLPTAPERAAAALAPDVDWTPARASARRVRRESLLALARRELFAGRGGAAESTLRGLLVEAPGLLGARHLLAQRLWATGRTAEFAAVADAGRRLHGEGPLADASRLLEALAGRDWPAFDALLPRAMAWPAWPFNLHLVAARARQARGDRAGVLASLEAAVAHDPGDVDAWRHLGAALERAGRAADAAHALGRAVALRPGEPQLLKRLAVLQARAGDASAALASLRRGADRAP